MNKLIFILLAVTCICPQSAMAKNVILFLGDGMGISTVTAARIFAGQQKGLSGEEYDLAFDKFEHVALVKTYNVDAQVPDSAGTISAIVTGEKTRMGMLSVTADVPRGDCAASLKHQVPSILELAEEAGLSSGIISTARITHATPAGTYAHVPDRDWENSSEMSDADRALGCSDIASQLVNFPHGDGVDVILGGGRAQFLPREFQDPENAEKTGARDDGNNLIDAWLKQSNQRHYAWNQSAFNDFNVRKGDQFMGLFERSHMQFEADREKDAGGEPSIREMTKFALEQLSTNENGYFLLVEGGRIDHAHHFGNAYRALSDTVAMSDAVKQAISMVDLEETLIIVTADHSHTLTISGYPKRGNPILGKVEQVEGFPAMLVEGKPYTTLSYANGRGYREELPDLTEIDTTDPNYQQLATVPLPAETHAGEDVAAFATGLNAEGVGGVMEQNKLFNVMRDALFKK